MDSSESHSSDAEIITQGKPHDTGTTVTPTASSSSGRIPKPQASIIAPKKSYPSLPMQKLALLQPTVTSPTTMTSKVKAPTLASKESNAATPQQVTSRASPTVNEGKSAKKAKTVNEGKSAKKAKTTAGDEGWAK